MQVDSSNSVTSTSEFRPYGQRAIGTPTDGPGYSGHVEDLTSGLIYMQARYYDAGIGRFLSEDPSAPSPGNIHTFSRFEYANDRPIGTIDPDGRQAQVVISWASQLAYQAQNFRVDTKVLTNRSSIEFTGMAAAGIGGRFTGGLYHADTSVAFLPVAEGSEMSLDYKFKSLQFKLHDAKESGYSMNGSASLHIGAGGKVNFEYDPGGILTVYLSVGVGAGESTSYFDLTKTLFKAADGEKQGEQSKSEDVRDTCLDFMCRENQRLNDTSRISGPEEDPRSPMVMN